MSQPSLATADNFDRPPSIRSVASASSLTRRSRIRARSNTVIGASPGPSSGPPDEGVPKSDFLTADQVHSHPSTSSVTSSPTMNVRSIAETHLTGFGGEGVETGSSHVQHEEDNTLVVSEQPHLEGVVASLSKTKLNKAAVQAAALSRINTAVKPPPSAFSRVPITPRNGSNIRDSINSVATRISTTSSSLYPPSTSTASGTESPPSPRSLAEQMDDHAISSYDPEVDEDVHAFDGDDVSYRLRLLVKNSYFLPPAHAKPTPSDFASAQPTQKKPVRNAAPGFLDLFRVGKSKSKPPSPDATPTDARVPGLRTTGESVTLGAYPSRHNPRSNPATPLRSPLSGQKPPDLSARVVVVREKMLDLATAAKQSEQEMKTRGARREEDTGPAKVDTISVIDPTDAVDLPPPSSKYGFAAQASALHGLGVQDSVGAALLADTLPPPMSPDASVDAEDRNWRKALLHAAVGHSLDNTPDVSTLSISPEPVASPPWSRSPVTSPPISRTQSPSVKRALGQRIVSQPLIEIYDEHPESPLRESTSRKQAPTPVVIPASRRSSYFPMRAETPAGPQTPLSPPPRRNLINPLYSLSQTDLANPDPVPQIQGTSPKSNRAVDIRSSLSSPEPSGAYESARLLVMTPPPTHSSAYSGSSIFATRPVTGSASQAPTSSSASSMANAETAESHYSDDDQEDDYDHPRRVSTAMSAPTDGRPSFSISEYSQPSPTVSAFQDALTGDDYHSAVSSFNHPWRSSEDQNMSSRSRDSPAPRCSTMSPPPRASSSLAPHPLPPPPRSLYQAVHQVRPPAVQPQSFLDLGEPSPASPNPPPPEILAPEPITPPFPIAERRGNPASTSLSLHIPDEHIAVSIHSAPAPSSPTSFFDSIQAQPNAMDDLESSSDEDSEDDEDEDEDNYEGNGGHEPTNLYADARTRTMSTVTARPPARPPVRPSLMRLGNHSSPHIARPMEDRPDLPISNIISRQPVSNIPARLPFFSDRKANKVFHPTMGPEFTQYTSMGSAEDVGPSSSVGRRPATADQPMRSWQASQQESSRRLEGMLRQHMEAEKDVIKRITSTLHTNPAGTSSKP